MKKEIFDNIKVILCVIAGFLVLAFVAEYMEGRPKEIHCTYCGDTISSEDALCAYCYFNEDQYDKVRDMVREEAIDIYTLADVIWDIGGYEMFENVLEAKGAMVFYDEIEVEEYVLENWSNG